MTSVSTPSSAGSPPVIAPALAPAPQVKPAASPSPGVTGSVTTKEWVIPPRPKPGRKPATDTPPTKRKAQNRAAQRAFRERRAARVGELEEQIKKIELEHEAQSTKFKEQIADLNRELEQCQREISWWKTRCHSLEQEVSLERTAKENLQRQSRLSTDTSQQDTVPISIRRSTNDNQHGERQTSRSVSIISSTEAREGRQEIVPSGCGSCSNTRCQCLEDAFQISNLVDNNDNSSPKRPHSPGKDDSSKLHHAEPQVKPEPEQMEIDFTARFAAPRNQTASESRAASTPPADRCGFCEDGTACICAEMADQAEQQDSFENNRLAPIQNLSQFTPPPSDGDVCSDLTLPSISQATNPCANGPGTCAQCLADPRSTLFCKSLAAARAAHGSSGGCCGGKGTDGGCCQSRSSTRNSTSNGKPPLTLTCADAYTTLSRHPNFSRASDELATWLPKLHTLPKPRDVSLKDNIGNRPAMEVEAASVMGVLRYFDRRFADK
ncbi:hypothetical protein VTN96DRAFT_2042 [Rasamsonia emersonii]|uniref:BZIP transcription factor (HapX) n=1 Tax=Rasamsonia emersonii (strain ATCC 16479 / CBS 393.64 / IMI 116815) TaxID=1408163 RepID=A0A0F4YU60_RASE3|nr:BZIP transcription factor (HapX) [Rasamsonia emersonii CBS 393.64]KKA21822.1 BZIP transcription factor (HapX) [Rasamsonia emersonii CBS 393.64]